MGEEPRRPQIGVDAEAGAQGEEAFFGPEMARHRVPLGAAHGAEEDGVAGARLLQRFRRQGKADFVQGGTAHEEAREVEGMAEFPADGGEHCDRAGDNLGPDAVPGNKRDSVVHDSILFG